MMLIDTTPGPSVEVHVIRDMWTEGEHLRSFSLVTNLDAWGYARFAWDEKCLSEGAIPFHDRNHDRNLHDRADSKLAAKCWAIASLVPAIFLSFPPWRSTCLTLFTCDEDVILLPSAGWRHRDI